MDAPAIRGSEEVIVSVAGTATRVRDRVEQRLTPDRSRTERLVDTVTPNGGATDRVADAVERGTEPAREAIARLEPTVERLVERLESARESLNAAEEAAERAAERVAARSREAAERFAGYVEEHVDEDTVRTWGPRFAFTLTGFLAGFLLGWLVARSRRPEPDLWDEPDEGLAQAPRHDLDIEVPRSAAGGSGDTVG